MDAKGLRYAKHRLDTAQEALLAMNYPNLDRAEAERCWIIFIEASNSFFSKLQQASKASRESNQWFAEVKKQRREDELMNYLHQVRNASEHSLKLSIEVPTIPNILKFSITVRDLTAQEVAQREALEERQKKLAEFDKSTPLHSHPVRSRGILYSSNGIHKGLFWGRLTAVQMAYLAIKEMTRLFDEASSI